VEWLGEGATNGQMLMADDSRIDQYSHVRQSEIANDQPDEIMHYRLTICTNAPRNCGDGNA
jgi:hypothetical protein